MPARKPRSLEERYPLVEYMPELLELAKQQLPVLRDEVNSYSNFYRDCAYTWVYEDGTARPEPIIYACYNHLQKQVYDSSNVAYFCTYRKPNSQVRLGETFPNGADDARGFYQWLLNESIFAPVFVTKDPIEAWNDGIICHTHFPAVYMVQGCAYGRYPKELPDIVRWWYRLSQHIDKHAALVLAHYLRTDVRKPEHYYVLANHAQCNAVFDFNQMGVQELTRMVNKDLRLLRDKPFSQRQGPYREFTRMFRVSGLLKHENIIKDGPLISFSGAPNDKWMIKDRWGHVNEHVYPTFPMDTLEVDAKRFFEENYAGKDYA